MFLAMLARDYMLDENRTYIAGLSAGGKTASRVSSAKPELFRGGVDIGGVIRCDRLWELVSKQYCVFNIDLNKPIMR